MKRFNIENDFFMKLVAIFRWSIKYICKLKTSLFSFKFNISRQLYTCRYIQLINEVIR